MNVTQQWGRIIRHARSRKGIAVIIVVILILFFVFRDNAKEDTNAPTTSPRTVNTMKIEELSRSGSPLSLLGTVVSQQEAVVRGESSGRVTVYKRLGDTVSPGAVIAEFENSTERAAVESATGAYESAQAALRASGISGSIATINTDSAVTTIESANTQVLNAIRSAYATLDDATRAKTNPMFANPGQRDARFVPSIPDAKLVIDIETAHLPILDAVTNREERNRTLTTTSDLRAELDLVETELNATVRYLDNIARALSIAIPDASTGRTTIDAWKATVAQTRSGVIGSLSSVSGARTALNASISGSKIAQESLLQATQGGGAIAEANLRSAKGNLDAARARLEKTIVRSPIAGSITALPVSSGDILSPYTEIATIANNGALEVLVQATEGDAAMLRIGGEVLVDKTFKGRITRIAPALDPRTKKVEVRIALIEGGKVLRNGSSVRITTERTIMKTSPDDQLRVPLTAIKITPEGSFVFTVNASSTLVAHNVTEGALLGDMIVIADGVTPDMEIVVDARGLRSGQTVTRK